MGKNSLQEITNNFFEEWKDSNKKIISFAVSEAIIFLLVLTWITINIPSESARAGIFLWLLLASAIVAGLDTISEKNIFFRYVDYGDSILMIVLAVLAGIGLAVFLSIGSFSLVVPLAVVGTGFFGLIYVGIVAPFIEEKFFRGFLNPTSVGLFKNFGLPFAGIMGIIFSSFVFGVFHWFAYGGALVLLFTAMFFGLIVSFGNYGFKTRAFGVACHVMVNLIALGVFL